MRHSCKLYLSRASLLQPTVSLPQKEEGKVRRVTADLELWYKRHIAEAATRRLIATIALTRLIMILAIAARSLSRQ